MNQRENLEYHAIQSFISQYNRTHKRQLRFLRACQPPMPDGLCLLGTQEVGVEVVHMYGTPEEAAIRLGNRQSEDIPASVHRARRITPLDIRALNSLNAVLGNKGGKRYSISPTWLIIRNAFALWTLGDYQCHRKEIRLPEGHPFQKVWILCDHNSAGRPGILRVNEEEA